MASFGLTLANRGVIIGAVTVPELFEMAKRGEDSGAFDAVWVGDSLLAKPRLESITLLSALAVVTKKVRLAVGCMATFPQRAPRIARAAMGQPGCHLGRARLVGGLFRWTQRAESRASARASGHGHQRY